MALELPPVPDPRPGDPAVVAALAVGVRLDDPFPQLYRDDRAADEAIRQVVVALRQGLLDVAGAVDALGGLAGGGQVPAGVSADDLARALEGLYARPAGGIPRADLAPEVQTLLDRPGGTGGITQAQLDDAVSDLYDLPSGGVPRDDLASDVVKSLDRADAALQVVATQAEADALPAGVYAVVLGDPGVAPYVVPPGGIPLSDLSAEARAKIGSGGAAGVSTNTLAMALAIEDCAPRTLYSTQNPAAEYDPTTNKTYCAYLGARRDLYLRTFDHATYQWQEPVYVGPYYIDNRDDDHGAPSLAIDQDKRRIAIFYGVHNQQQAVATSGPGLDITTWNVQRLTRTGSYGILVYDATTKALYASFRAGIGHGSSYPTHEFGSLMRSTDGGVNWTDVAPTAGLVNTKVSYTADAASDYYGSDVDAAGGKIYMAFAVAHGARHDGPRAGARIAYYDTTTSTMRTVGGVSLGGSIDTAEKMDQCLIPGTNQDYIYPVKIAINPAGQLLAAYNKYNASTDLVECTTALWDGAVWQVRDTGIRSNYLYHGVAPAWRDGRWELACVRLLGGDRTVASTSQLDVLAGSSGGGDLIILASTDALSWTQDSFFDRRRFISGGCMYLQSVRAAHPDLVFLAQPIALGTVFNKAGGAEEEGDQASYNTPSWYSPVYALHSRSVLPRLVGVQPRPEQLLRINPWYIINDAGTPPPTAWSTVSLAGFVPRDTTEVTLKVAVTGTGSAGRCVLSFREGSTSRNSDAQVSSRGEWTDGMVYDVVVPLSPARSYQWMASDSGRVTVKIVPRALRIGTLARSTGPAAAATTSDQSAPTTPGTPTAAAGPGSASVTTSGSTDNVAVTGYRWYRSGSQVGATSGTTFNETGLTAGTAVSYTVAAVDAAGNISAQSEPSNSVTPTASTGNAETVAFSDDFTRADATGGWGNGWTTAGTDIGIIGGNQAGSAYRSGSTGTKWWENATKPSSVNQYAQVTVAVFPRSDTNHPHLMVRGSSGAASGYFMRWNVATLAWELYRLASGTATLLTSTPADAPTEGYVMRAEIDASATIRLKVNGAQVISFQDTNGPLTTGTPFVGLRNLSTSDDRQRIDNYITGNLAA